MSTFNLFGYNYLTIPRFDFMLKLESGKSFYLSHYYMKYLALFCFVSGLTSLYYIYKSSKFYAKRLVNSLKKESIDKDNFVVVLGFGDSDTSVLITSFFSNLGYNVLVLNNKRIIDHRLKHDLNKAQDLDKLKGNFTMLNYEELNKDKLDNLIKKGKIDFIFDCSILRVFTSFNNETISKTNTKSEENIFYFEEIEKVMKGYYDMIELIKLYLNKTRIYVLDFIDKRDDVNHKLLNDFKFTLFKNYSEIYKEDIFTAKKIKLYNIQGKRLLNDKDLEHVFKYSLIKEQDFNFI